MKLRDVKIGKVYRLDIPGKKTHPRNGAASLKPSANPSFPGCSTVFAKKYSNTYMGDLDGKEIAVLSINTQDPASVKFYFTSDSPTCFHSCWASHIKLEKPTYISPFTGKPT